MATRRLLLGAALPLLLSACAGLQPQAARPGIAAESAPARLSGRFSLNLMGGPRRQNHSAGFELLGTAERGQLELSTPLGSLVARVRWQPGQAWLSTPEGERDFADMDELTATLLGEALPVQALFDWLEGRPWPLAAHQPLPENGFRQLGWQVDLRRFADGLISAERQTPQGEQALLRLKLDKP